MFDEKKASELEKAVREVSTVPEPDAEFIRSLRARFVAEGHASAIKHQESPMSQRKRSTRVVIVFVLVVLVLLAVSPIGVSALRRLLGYVPNVGIIDQSSQVMVLSEPVSITREGFALTVEQVVLSEMKLTIVYSYIVPADFLFIPDPRGMFGDSPYVILPDGTRVDILSARQVSTADCPQCSMRYAMEFAPMPNGIEAVTLELPTLVTMQVGVAPENWSIPLKLNVAGPDDLAPVIEVTIAPTTIATESVTSIPNVTATPETYGITNTLDKFVVLPDGYVLYGTLAWQDASVLPYGAGQTLAKVTDANGMDVPFDYADPEMYAMTSDQKYYWAYKVGKDFTAPLKLDFAITASLPADGGSFTFDPGLNPQMGQKWDINQDVVVNGEIVHVLTAEQGGIEPGFFQFIMQSDSNIIGASIIDLDHPPMGGGGGGGGLPEIGVPFGANYGYQMPLPPGPWTFTFTDVYLLLPGEWSLTWSP